MLVSVHELLGPAQGDGYAVASFNVFNMETALGAVRAAEMLGAPVVLALSARHARNVSLSAYSEFALSLARGSAIPVALHLDHAGDADLIAAALRNGFTSVMFDGAGLPFDQKVAQTRRFVEQAHAQGATCEAELEHIGRAGVEDGEGLTQPDRAKEFVSRTGIDVLAVSVGTQHGLSRGRAHIDRGLLAELRTQVGCFLSLHGGSGVSPEELRETARAGISKVSYFTSMSRAAIQRIAELAESAGPSDLQAVLLGVQSAFEQGCLEMIPVFGSDGKARSN